jgi:hypothetical protein
MPDKTHIGCLVCGSVIEIAAPDDFYTSSRRKFVSSSNDDMLPMNVGCECGTKFILNWYPRDT